MTWTGNPRTTTPEWRATRIRILQRDRGVCWICKRPGANEVDHKQALAEGGADSDSNLAAICERCHRAKSSAEGNRARHKHRAARPPEPHPGLLG